ncbi:hypothetical protein BH20ACT16_BH20ACT16_12460 [soil metagenome]
MEASEEQALPGECKEWKALQGPGIIVVDCFALFHTAGWKMQLVKAEEQSDDPEELILDRVVEFPQGYQPPVIRGIDVHFEEQTDVEYKTVTIQPDGLTLEVVDKREAPSAARAPTTRLEP